MIGAKFYSGSTLLDRQVLQSLQDALRRVFPEWSDRVYVVEDEEEMHAGRQLDVRKPSHLYSILHAEAERCRPFRLLVYQNHLKNLRASGSKHAPPPYDSDSWSDHFTITDHIQDIMLFLDYSTKPTRLEENYVSIHCYNHKAEGISSSVLMQAAFLELVEKIPFDWGCIHSDAEFDSSNRDEKNQVTGVFLDKGLPGLYWISYFGPLYCEAIVYERLQSAPGAWVKALPEGVAIGLGNCPDEWNTPEYRSCRRAVEEHLGKQWFNSKDEPKRKLLTPKLKSV